MVAPTVEQRRARMAQRTAKDAEREWFEAARKREEKRGLHVVKRFYEEQEPAVTDEMEDQDCLFLLWCLYNDMYLNSLDW